LTAEVQWVLNRGVGYPLILHHMMQRSPARIMLSLCVFQEEEWS